MIDMAAPNAGVAEDDPRRANLRQAMRMLFEARSVAIIGASGDPTKLSSMPAVAMELLGFGGTVVAVNPRYQSVGKWPCVPDIAALPSDIEAGIILLPASQAVEAAKALVARGVKALVIVAQGFGESGEQGRVLEQQLVALSRAHGVAISGPNTNGLANVQTGLSLSFAPALLAKERVPRGRVSIVSQSGAMISCILARTAERGIGIAKFASCGNELLLGVADYLEFFAQDDETDAIVLYLETIRDPAGLKRALQAAKSAGKRIVAMKVGESENGKKATLSHTGAIAGSYRNTLAFLRKEGVALAEDIDSLAALAELVMRYPMPLSEPPRTAMISVSGGYAALAADCMARLGMAFEELSDRAKMELGTLPIQSHPINPYDTAAQHMIIDQVFDIFRRDGFNQLMIGMTPLAAEVRKVMLPKLAGARQQFDQVYVFAPGLPAEEVRELQEAGVCVSFSLIPQMQALRAMRAVEAVAPTKIPRKPVPAGAGPDGSSHMLDEAESKAFLAEAGIRVPRGLVVEGSPRIDTIMELRRPLALKGLSRSVAHKSDHGMVALDLNSDADILSRWAEIRDRSREADPDSTSILVEEMAEAGLETIVGFYRDPVVGPVVVVGAGGILAEFLDDSVVLLPPFDTGDVKRALDTTRLGRLLRGYRGRSFDLDALSNAVVALGKLGAKLANVSAIDINPMLVSSEGVLALDAKVFLCNSSSRTVISGKPALLEKQ